MQILKKTLNNLNLKTPSIVTIGFFDSFHLGHQKILKKMSEEFSFLKKIVITFNTKLGREFNLLSEQEKISAFENFNIDYLFILDLKKYYKLSYQEFLILLKNYLNMKYLILGENASFGKNKKGNRENIQKIEKSMLFHSIYLPLEKINDKVISTSLLKEMIIKKNFELVNMILYKTKN